MFIGLCQVKGYYQLTREGKVVQRLVSVVVTWVLSAVQKDYNFIGKNFHSTNKVFEGLYEETSFFLMKNC